MGLEQYNKTKKVTIAMHCNLRPPNVASVVLGSNYEVSLQIQQFCNLRGPIMRPHTKLRRNRKIRCGVTAI